VARDFGCNRAGMERVHRKRRRVWPSKRETRAVELGSDELQQRVEWELRHRPRALRNARRRYAAFCSLLLRRLENAAPDPARRRAA